MVGYPLRAPHSSRLIYSAHAALARYSSLYSSISLILYMSHLFLYMLYMLTVIIYIFSYFIAVGGAKIYIRSTVGQQILNVGIGNIGYELVRSVEYKK